MYRIIFLLLFFEHVRIVHEVLSLSSLPSLNHSSINLFSQEITPSRMKFSFFFLIFCFKFLIIYRFSPILQYIMVNEFPPFFIKFKYIVVLYIFYYSFVIGVLFFRFFEFKIYKSFKESIFRI